MPIDTEYKVTALFDQAVQAMSDTMKAGVKMNEEVAKLWTEVLDRGSPMHEWQKHGRAILNELVPTAQKNAEEWMKLMESNYRRGSEVLEQAIKSEPADSTAEVEAKTRELWNASVGAVRESAQAIATTNLRVLQLWTDAMRKGADGASKAAVAAK